MTGIVDLHVHIQPFHMLKPDVRATFWKTPEDAAAAEAMAADPRVLLARMDADDVCLPERFARQVAFLDTHPEVGVLGRICCCCCFCFFIPISSIIKHFFYLNCFISSST